jgi:hypothetical protein
LKIEELSGLIKKRCNIAVFENDRELLINILNSFEEIKNTNSSFSSNVSEKGSDEESVSFNYSENSLSVESNICDKKYGVKSFKLHDHVVFDTFHCPPFPDTPEGLENTMKQPCNCSSYGVLFQKCAKLWGIGDPIDWGEEREFALKTINNDKRQSNSTKRKDLYKSVYRAYENGVLMERGQVTQIRLANCAEAKVRQVYPSSDGFYMGYSENNMGYMDVSTIK